MSKKENYLQQELGLDKKSSEAIRLLMDEGMLEPLLVDFVEQSFTDQHEGIEIKFTSTVYPYVPVKVVDEVIKKHGGIKEDVCVD